MVGKKQWVAAFGLSAASAFVLGFSPDAAAFWKRGAASSCSVSKDSVIAFRGVVKVLPSSVANFADAADCAYPDDENLPHASVTNLNVHGDASPSPDSHSHTDPTDLPEEKSHQSLGLRHRLDHVLISFALTENVQNINNTPDIGLLLGMTWMPGR